MKAIQYGQYRLDIAGENKERICYIILPAGLKENECSWAEEAARKFSANIAVISGADWDNDLTPWPAPGLPGQQNVISEQEDIIPTRQDMTTGQENMVSEHHQVSERQDLDTIYLAGGCFWGLEKYFKLIRGVTDTQVGFVNGHTENPTYKEVYTDTTGYAECVRVVFDPAVLPLEKLLEFYFKAIDPTSENKQGEDIGTRYRCGIFYSPDSPADMAVIREIHDRKEKEFGRIFVETGPMVSYTPAEEYHQDYLQKNPGGYCHLRPELYEFAAKVNRP